jgi:hypothetical protein
MDATTSSRMKLVAGLSVFPEQGVQESAIVFVEPAVLCCVWISLLVMCIKMLKFQSNGLP